MHATLLMCHNKILKCFHVLKGKINMNTPHFKQGVKQGFLKKKLMFYANGTLKLTLVLAP